MTERLRKEIEDKEILPESQAGFRMGVGVLWITYTYIIHTTVRGRKRGKTKKKGKVCAFFIDLKAAFPSVNRAKLWKVMTERGIKKWLIERVRKIYKETKDRVRVGKGIGRILDRVKVETRVPAADMEEVLKRGLEGGIAVGEADFGH